MQNNNKTYSFNALVSIIYTAFAVNVREEGMDFPFYPSEKQTEVVEKKNLVRLGRKERIIDGYPAPESNTLPTEITSIIQDAIAHAALGRKITPDAARNLEHFGTCLAYMQKKMALKDLEPDTLAELFAKSVNQVVSQRCAPGGLGR